MWQIVSLFYPDFIQSLPPKRDLGAIANNQSRLIKNIKEKTEISLGDICTVLFKQLISTGIFR